MAVFSYLQRDRECSFDHDEHLLSGGLLQWLHTGSGEKGAPEIHHPTAGGPGPRALLHSKNGDPDGDRLIRGPQTPPETGLPRLPSSCAPLQGDYDGRTPIHIAASDGEIEAASFLVKVPTPSQIMAAYISCPSMSTIDEP